VIEKLVRMFVSWCWNSYIYNVSNGATVW